MKVRIICYEDVHAWILGKFALKMQENLSKLGVEVDIAKFPDKTADINHHIIYYDWNAQPSHNDTIMITHIDNLEKLENIKKQVEVAKLGICMSKEHMYYLAKMGVDKNKLCYVNPAQDNVMQIKKIVIGWANQVQIDGRKNEKYIDDLVKVLNPKYFKFRIMGKNWDEKVEVLRTHGFETDYFNDFDYNQYLKFIPSLDYYMYMGMDEGHMGVLDALSAGVKTIITTQGYHLDAENGITHGFKTYDELEKILLNIQHEKDQLVQSVATWNWLDYTKKHLELWKYVLDSTQNKSEFRDGLNSLLKMQQQTISLDTDFISKKFEELKANSEKHRQNILKLYETKIKKYKLFGITILKKKKTATKIKLYFLGFLPIFVMKRRAL